MANVHQLLIKTRFKGNLSTNCFLVPSASFLQLGQRFGPHPNTNIESLRNYSSSCSLVNNNAGASSVVACDHYDKVTNLNDALNSYKVMIHKRPLPSVVKFTRLLHDVTKLKHYACSLYLFKQISALGVPVNTYTTGIAIKCYHRLKRTKYGLAVLGSCFKQGVELHVSTYNTLLKGFVLNNTHLAEHLFRDFISSNRLSELNLVSYKIMVKGLCKIGDSFTAIGLLRLIDHGILDGGKSKLDVVIYNTIFESLCSDIIFIDYAFKLFKEMVHHKGIQPNIHTYNSLIRNLCKLGRWDEVCRMLKQMEDEKISPKVKTFNIIVDALCKQGKIDEAKAVIDIMNDETGGQYPPNAVTYNPLIDFYCWRRKMSEARGIYDSLDSKGIKPNYVTDHELLLGYLIDGKKRKFYDFYDDIKTTCLAFFLADEVSSNTSDKFSFPKYIGSYRSIIMRLPYDEALVFMCLMDRSGHNSELYPHDELIEGAIKHRRFDDARRHFHNLLVKGMKPDGFIYIFLIDGFIKAGLFREAI
uniref:pentatricopeptide repeat-containing protein At1g63130, mitochondrial-like n=1 Tax=Erigeron canadensis TaxID=72917 RepID=UPI001CB96994|nr:pentatricopeptide repeat-containing protein At1g63130, mitochondrial-like [Erigeron canadensis]